LRFRPDFSAQGDFDLMGHVYESLAAFFVGQLGSWLLSSRRTSVLFQRSI
jgi:hypothetical protein